MRWDIVATGIISFLVVSAIVADVFGVIALLFLLMGALAILITCIGLEAGTTAVPESINEFIN